MNIKPPSKEPLIKLVPIMKLIGNAIVSSINRSTSALFELFWIPISNKKKKMTFIVVLNRIPLNLTYIFSKPTSVFNTDYKSNFS